VCRKKRDIASFIESQKLFSSGGAAVAGACAQMIDVSIEFAAISGWRSQDMVTPALQAKPATIGCRARS
jgi:hypothetical protein